MISVHALTWSASMAVKTITIDMEAYRRLKKAKKPNESFSQAIKRIVKEPVDWDEVIAKMKKVSPDVWDHVEEQIRLRRAPHNMVR
jgi:predicted CopG family antitoxin